MGYPTQLQRIRRNHALEHATVALLLERGIRPPLGGYSVPGGYVIWSKAPCEQISEAINDALKLLNAGQHELAISPHCGTNISVGILIGSVTAVIVRGRNRGLGANVRAAIVAMAATALLSKPLGIFIQRKITTDSRLNDLKITSIRKVLGSPINILWVSTQSAS